MDNIEAWEKRPLLSCGKRSGGWYQLHVSQIIENLSSHRSRFFCDLLGMRAVEKSYPRLLAGRLFYLLCLPGITYRHKDAIGASCDYGAVYQASAWSSGGVDTFVQRPSQNQSYRTTRGKSYAISKKLRLYCVTCHLSHNKSLCWYHYLVISLSR